MKVHVKRQFGTASSLDEAWSRKCDLHKVDPCGIFVAEQDFFGRLFVAVGNDFYTSHLNHRTFKIVVAPKKQLGDYI